MRIGAIGIFAFVLVLVFALGAPAAVYTWNWSANGNWDNSGGQGNWNTGVGGAFPDAVDDTANVDGQNMTIDLDGQTITLGTLNFTSGMWSPAVLSLQNGTLNFQVSSGSAVIHDLKDPWAMNPELIKANVQLSSPLIINETEFGQWGFGWSSNNTIEIDGVISGNNSLTKTGPGTLYLTNTGNSFTGNINVQEGLLRFDNLSVLGNPANSLCLGGVGTVGRLLIGDNAWPIPPIATITNAFVLSGEGGEIRSCAWPTNFNNVISGIGNLFISDGGWTQFNNTSDNTYVGDTKVLTWAAATTTARIFNGNITVQGFGQLDLLSANNISPSAVVLVSSFNTPCRTTCLPATLTLGSDFFPNIDPKSSGLIAFGRNTLTGPAINARLAVGAPQVGNGYMSYGGGGIGTGGSVFTGTSLQPDLDHVYRFTPTTGENDWFVLHTPSGVGCLTDVGGVATSVEITALPAQQCGQLMQTQDTNDFTGSLTINPSVVLQGYASPGGSPFGSSAAFGALNINGADLTLISYQNAPAAITKGVLSIEGQAVIGLATADTNCIAAISVTDIIRNNRAILGISPNSQGTLGGNAQLLDTSTANPIINGDNGTMAPAYFVRYDNVGFLRYDSVKGFVDAAFTATDSFGANNGTDIVNLTAGGVVPAGGASVYALRTNGALTGGQITIAGGGLIVATGGDWGAPLTHTAAIDFGSAEGIIFVSGSWSGNWRVSCNQFNGTISGTNGLTFGATLNGNSARRINITSDNTNTLFGQITINEGMIAITNAGALGSPNNMILLNGGTGVNGNSLCGALLIDADGSTLAPYWANITLANPFTIGPNGGTIMLDYATGSMTLTNKITGPGALTIAGHVQETFTLTNGTNDYTGGTMIRGCNFVVSPTGKLGPGPVLINDGSGNGYYGILNLEGAANTDSTNDIALYIGQGFDGDGSSLNVIAPTTTIGTLSGNGHVMLNYWQSQRNTTLTLGNSESSDFYGVIQDPDQGNFGNIVKQGTGTFTFWGEGVYEGTTTVNEGTFVVNGKVAGSGVTVSGGTLGGTGLVTAPVVVAGGTLGGSLTVNNSVTLNSGAINAAGTINGTLTANAGTVAGTTAVNGNVVVAGSTVTGQHAVSGNVTISSGSFTADPGTTLGSLNVTSTGAYAGSSAIAGAVQMDAGTIAGTHTIAGNYTQNGGSFSGTSTIGTALAPVAVNVNAGSFSGNHTVYGSFTTAAGSNVVLATHNGASAGTLTINGTVTLDHSTVLNFNLGAPGTTGSSVNDLISVVGALSLDGTLNVNNLSGFGPGVYTLIDYSGLLSGAGLTKGAMPTGLGYSYTIDTGVANEINLDVTVAYSPYDTNRDGSVNSLDVDWIYQNLTVAPATYSGTWPRPLKPYNSWCDVNSDGGVSQADVTYELNHYFLTSYGDADMNKATDFQDFQILLNHWQATGGGIGWGTADFNGDGVVDFLDFQILLNYWNPGGWNIAPSQVPEPASLTLILLGALGLVRRSRRGRSR